MMENKKFPWELGEDDEYETELFGVLGFEWLRLNDKIHHKATRMVSEILVIR